MVKVLRKKRAKLKKKKVKKVKVKRKKAKASRESKIKNINMEFKVENIVASANLNVELNLFEIATKLSNVEYEPEQFPGAIMRLKEMGTTLLLFKNGKIICSGAKSEAQIAASIKRAVELLKRFIE